MIQQGEVSIEKRTPPKYDGQLRAFALRVPEAIYQASGILVFGRRIKSLVFSTDLCIIRNVNADAIIAVYPFTPQPVITQALLMAADIPVFAGVGGGLTQGPRVLNLAMNAENQGAFGIVLNAPTRDESIRAVNERTAIRTMLRASRRAPTCSTSPPPPKRRRSCERSARSFRIFRSSPPAVRPRRASSARSTPAQTPSPGPRPPTARSSGTSWRRIGKKNRILKKGDCVEGERMIL